MTATLVFLTCIGTGIIGGVFFAFSVFVMRALGQLPPAQGIAAMQRINVTVLHPAFLGVFMGTAVLSAGCLVSVFWPGAAPRSWPAAAAGLLYLVGTFLVTVAANVPRNHRLAAFPADSQEAAAYWPVYVREWSWWNHVRAAAAILASACAAAALMRWT